MAINLSQFIVKTRGMLSRFPVCLVFLLCLTVQLIVLKFIDTEPDALTFFACVGIVLSLLQHLCAEANPRFNFELIFQKKENDDFHLSFHSPIVPLYWFLPILLLAVDSIMLQREDKITPAIITAQGAFVLALLVAVCFVPFWKEKNDLRSWNFVWRSVWAAIIAELIGGFMCGALLLLYYGSAELFGFKTDENFIVIIVVLFLITLPTLLFLIRIPRIKKVSDEAKPNAFLMGVTKYLFLPLAILYMVVLYVYGIDIIVTWELPNGMLSGLVSTLMFVIIGITFLIYPWNGTHKPEEKELSPWAIKTLRVLPYLVLPLLVLMSVGIGRRLSDYGITANRLYLLTLNIWFYAVAIGLCINKAHRIHWISISFSILLLLTSCHPFNYTNIYRNILQSRFEAITRQFPIKQKIEDDQGLTRYLKSMPQELARQAYQTIDDINHFDDELFNDQVSIYTYGDFDSFMETKTEALDSYSMSYFYANEDVPVPEGYSQVKYYESPYCTLSTSSTPIESKNKNNDYAPDERNLGTDCNDSTFIHHHEDLGAMVIPHRDLKPGKLYTIPLEDEDGVFLLTHLDITDENGDHQELRYNLSGYFFYNPKVRK